MPTKENLKKGLVGLGIASIIAGGIVGYFFLEKTYLTWEEYQDVIRAYNVKIESIKKNCNKDTRCIKVKNKEYVVFGLVKGKKGILNKLNKWVEEDDSLYQK